MTSIFYLAAWTDSDLFVTCEHKHLTVVSAANCISVAGGYVIAVENGGFRTLNDKERLIVRGRLRVIRPAA